MTHDQRHSVPTLPLSGLLLAAVAATTALLLAHHYQVYSLRTLTLLGLAVNLLGSALALPALVAVRTLTPRQEALPSPVPGLVERIVHALATVGFAGYSPVSPGTLGALAALPIGWLLADRPWWWWASVLLGGSLLSITVVDRYLQDRSADDPREVVLDEFIGCLTALAFVPWRIPWIIAAFGLFRLLDIVKPAPIRTVERHFHQGGGVIGDDLVAGIVAGGLLALLHAAGQWGGLF